MSSTVSDTRRPWLLPPEEVNDPTEVPTSSGAVLVIDDQEDVRETFQLALEASGFDVQAVAGGAEGLRALRGAKKVALVLLDLMMPNMDGWRFRNEQLADPRIAQVPVIVVTGAPLSEVVHSELGAADYLVKPVGMAHLVSVVERFCVRTDDPPR